MYDDCDWDSIGRRVKDESTRVFAWGYDGAAKVGRWFEPDEVPDGWEVSTDEDRPIERPYVPARPHKMQDEFEPGMKAGCYESGTVYKHLKDPDTGEFLRFKTGTKKGQIAEIKDCIRRKYGEELAAKHNFEID